MKISANTKVSVLLKDKPESIDVIASINKHFKKLKNPVLRKLLAPRVTISDAAKIGGTTVDVFLNKLQEIGFEIDMTKSEKVKSSVEKNDGDSKIFTKESIVELDVRPNIEAGNDPFKIILTAIKELPDNSVLKIINVFEPLPLINHLRDKGYESITERPEEGVVHTYFRKAAQVSKEDLPEIKLTDFSEFEMKTSEFGENIKTIDVRHLEMPEPMVTILQEVEKLPEGHALYVHHKRIPQFLLPELKKRDYIILYNEIDENNMNLLIYK
ncbi:MAG: hypothetical protein B6D61_08770 [Bacteroidetes bacterium 4484_249]|nr:MAG: hypothetical protein B6D61_08770 [Bacteroidetes bacterium 4484_249]